MPYRFYFIKCMAVAAFSFICFGCSSEKLLPLNKKQIDVPSVASKGEFCINEGIARTQKILFIVDKSASNLNDLNGGNDMEDLRRAANIQRFLDNYKDSEHISWSFIAFGVGDNEAQSYMPPDENGNVNRFGTSDELQVALDRHKNTQDNGCTPYLAALNLAKTTIQSDLLNNPDDNSIYNIFFLSDGFPRGGSECELEAVEDFPQNKFIDGVLGISNLYPNKIFFNTAYYALPENDPDREAAKGLQYMAKWGNGNFSDLREQDELDFNQLLVGIKPEAFTIKRLGVYNLNSAFCDDKTIDVDSDADGLCDKDEIRYNTLHKTQLDLLGKSFDPLNRYSIDDNYSDLFAFQQLVLATGSGLPACDERTEDADFDLLNSCEEEALMSLTTTGPTQTWSQALQTNGGTALTINPDSDGDGILDVIEYFMFKDEAAALNYENLFERFDGNMTGESLVWYHRHPLAPSIPQDDYDITFYETGTDEQGNHCYYFKQNNLPLYETQTTTYQNTRHLGLSHSAGENSILFYYIAVPRNQPHAPGVLYHSIQNLSFSGNSTLKTNLVERHQIKEFYAEINQ